MKTKVVTFTSAPNNYGHKQLIRSLEFWQVDYHVINEPWRGFGTKIIETAKYVETIKNEYTHFMFVDGHDTFFVRPINQNADMDMDFALISTEKGNWPLPPHPTLYPDSPTIDTPELGYFDKQIPWKYLNSGCYIFPIPLYLRMLSENPIEYGEDDQGWLRNIFLTQRDKYNLQLDYECKIFQSIAFKENGEFFFYKEVEQQVEFLNFITKSKPMVIHNNGGNAKNPMEWIYNLIS